MEHSSLFQFLSDNISHLNHSFPVAVSNRKAVVPLRHSGSHLTRSITLCLFQLKLTPFAVKSPVIPSRKVTHQAKATAQGPQMSLHVYYVVTRRSILSQRCLQVGHFSTQSEVEDRDLMEPYRWHGGHSCAHCCAKCVYHPQNYQIMLNQLF